MGNCQAVDAAVLVIQHPSGRIERMYWQVTASEVMKSNPGHYVSLIIPLPPDENSGDKTVRFTRVKLLRPSDTLVLGRAYRLVTSEEVVKVLRAKKNAKMKMNEKESAENVQRATGEEAQGRPATENAGQGTRQETYRRGQGSTNLTVAKSKSWRPSLHSISEVGGQ